MYWLVLAIPFLVISAICFLGFLNKEIRGLRPSDEDVPTWFGMGCSLVIVAMIPVIMGVVVSLLSSSKQIYNGTDLTKIERFETVYRNRSDNLTNQFAGYLAELYPEHERDIFSNISPEGVDIYLVKYPELKASETITALVQQIRQLEDDYYKQQLARAETLRDMNYRVQSPWIYQWLMRDVPIPAQ